MKAKQKSQSFIETLSLINEILSLPSDTEYQMMFPINWKLSFESI